ncbi:YcjF family protein [Verrucomicrobiota bacterium sgz303538]
MNLLSLYDKLERLVQRLPQPLQSPILREISPIKTLFLQKRPPRLLLIGDRAASRTELVNALFATEVAEPSEDYVQSGSWQLFSRAGRGNLRVLDARRPSTLSQVQRALSEEAPDAVIFLHTPPRAQEDLTPDLDHAKEIARLLKERHGGVAPVFAAAVGNPLGTPLLEVRQQLHDALDDLAERGFSDTAGGAFVTSQGATEVQRLASAIAAKLPHEAKLEMARLSGVQELQRELAQIVVKSMSAISGAVGAEPIPLADFPILTSVQAGMVAAIMHISGRELSLKLGGEWLAALGVNIGLGLAFREGARAVLKAIPVWGHVVSGGVAAAGTYAIGRAAIAYFIDGVSLQDARRLFRNKKPAALVDREKH